MGKSMTIKKYMNNIRNAAGTKLVESDGLYSGREGHIRFAYEVGYALNDFGVKEQEEFLHSSYSNVYVRACFLNPILDAKEWINLLQSQIKHREDI